MLPAIIADLPAYLTPPSPREAGTSSTHNAGFGPSARVSLTREQALALSSNEPGQGLYGPNGRFVEAAAKREPDASTKGAREADTRAEEQAADSHKTAPVAQAADAKRNQAAAAPTSAPHSTGESTQVDVPTDAAANTGNASARSGADPQAPEPPAPSSDSDAARQATRDLSLAEFDAAIPPAAREELRALADRVTRRTNGADLTADDYRQLSRLYDVLGRYDKATDALTKAQELESYGGADESEEAEASRELEAALAGD